MRPVTTMPGVTLTRQMIESGAPVEPARDFQIHETEIRRALNELAAELKPACAVMRAPIRRGRA